MTKEYKSLGLMSGTSGDGVDASVIQSDGAKKYKVLLDKYFKYTGAISSKIHNLKKKINSIIRRRTSFNCYSRNIRYGRF